MSYRAVLISLQLGRCYSYGCYSYGIMAHRINNPNVICTANVKYKSGAILQKISLNTNLTLSKKNFKNWLHNIHVDLNPQSAGLSPCVHRVAFSVVPQRHSPAMP